MSLETVLRPLSPASFLAPSSLEERLALAIDTARQRLYSHDAACAWLDWIGTHAGRIDPESIEMLMREVLLMSPEHPKAEAIYNALMRPAEPLPEGGRVVFMVTSCHKYLDQATRLQAELRAHRATACIVLGDPARRVLRWEDDTCVLPVEDNYESLPRKVAAGVAALVQRFGAIAVAKIDDDCRLMPSFTPDRFLQLARNFDYVGKLAVNPQMCRFWHFGKTSKPMGPYSRRHLGPWAGGACYLLGPRAAELVARESVLYPAEIADEYYEDKAIGDFLRRQGVSLSTIRHADWGISFDPSERLVDPAARRVEADAASARPPAAALP